MRGSLAVRLAVFVTALMCPAMAAAQAQQGDREVQIAGNVFQTMGDGSGFTMGNVILGFGYFISTRTQLAVQPILSITSFSTPQINSRGQITGSERQTETDMGLSTKLLRFFGEDSARMKPYLGATYIIQSMKEAGDTSFVAGNFGVKNYLTEKAALDFNGSYGFNVKDFGGGQLLQVTVGITYIF